MICELPQQSSANSMERSSPWQVYLSNAKSRFCDPFNPAYHFLGCPPWKRQQQDTVRIHTVNNQVRNSIGQRFGFARPRASNHQQRPRIDPLSVLYSMFDGLSLLRVQVIEVSKTHNNNLRNVRDRDF
jgi:hypothetical protein